MIFIYRQNAMLWMYLLTHGRKIANDATNSPSTRMGMRPGVKCGL